MTAEKNVDRVVQKLVFGDDRARPGVLVEVGAARPDFLSISASFRENGWRVIGIEPNPDFCELHRARGYTVHQYACSDVDADDQDFFVVDSKGAEYLGGSVSFESFSSLGIKDEFRELHRTVEKSTEVRAIKVRVRRLDAILAEHEPDLERIDLLAIDVEGWELNVLRGLSLGKYRPRVVILENLFDKPEYRDYMAGQGYRLWRRLEPNEVYFDEETFARVRADASLLERIARLFGR
jgi:FkbM family methyltransferase